jgi:Bacterial RNA polymerase, alpha chain C terminal domain
MLNVSDREFLAFHEAGHAVMAAMLRRPIRRASIREQHGLTGYVDYEQASAMIAEIRDEHRPLVETDALILLAGRAAECERTLGSPLSHASLDRQNARALLGALEDSEEVVMNWMRYLLVRAQSMLQAEWPYVHAVAHALMADEELDGAGVARVIADCRRQERSNVRVLIYEDALEAISDLPSAHCHPPTAEVVPFPLDRAAALRPPTDRPLDEAMQLSSRARKCLERAGIITLVDLARHTICALASLPGLGPATLDEITSEANRIGLTLAVS